MNLAEVQKLLDTKNKKRNQFIGQKEMLMETLKESGFSSIKEAKKEIKNLNQKITKLQEKYQEKEKSFKEKYEDLIYAD
jgi:pyridoxal biosynthesis lyase PdxS